MKYMNHDILKFSVFITVVFFIGANQRLQKEYFLREKIIINISQTTDEKTEFQMNNLCVMRKN